VAVGSKIDAVLEVLSDGKWHGIEKLRKHVKIDVDEVQEIVAFLNKYDFAEVNNANKKLKINKDFQKLLTENIT